MQFLYTCLWDVVWFKIFEPICMKIWWIVYIYDVSSLSITSNIMWMVFFLIKTFCFPDFGQLLQNAFSTFHKENLYVYIYIDVTSLVLVYLFFFILSFRALKFLFRKNENVLNCQTSMQLKVCFGQFSGNFGEFFIFLSIFIDFRYIVIELLGFIHLIKGISQ